MVSSDDPRKDYIARTLIDLFSSSSSNRGRLVQSSDDMQASLCSKVEMDKFLDESASAPLQASLVNLPDGKLDIELSNEVRLRSDAEAVVHFTKVDASMPITIDNIQRTVSISSMSQSAVQGLYNSIHNIFLPLLNKPGAVDEKVQALVQDLEAGLGSLLRGTAGGDRNLDEGSVKGILKLEDEASFWREVGDGSHSASTQRKAEFLQNQVNELVRTFRTHEDSSYEEMTSEGLQGGVQDILLNIWTMEELDDLDEVQARDPKFMYPQARMLHLFKLIGDAVTHFIQVKFDAADIWKSSFSQAEKDLGSAMDLCRAWMDITEELTRRYWKDWRGEVFRDPRIAGLYQRLNQISDVRATHDALQGLLSAEEQRGLQLDRAFSRFSGVKALHVNKYSDAVWAGTMSEYEASMQPTEDQIVAKLRGEFESNLLPGVSSAIAEQAERIGKGKGGKGQSSTAQPYQLLQGFSKYRLLLTRKTIESRLQSERDKLLSMLNTFIGQAHKEFESQDGLDGNSAHTQGKNLAGIVNNIVFITQLHFKVEQTVTAAKPLIANLRNSDEFERQSSELLRELVQAKAKIFDEWKESILDALNDREDPIALQTSAKLMSFDQKEGRLQVHYSERLVTLLREARQLCAMGCKIPPEVDKAVDTAHKFYHNAMVLKQVAAFYNTIGDQIIDCQQPMLIEEAMAFEKIVKDQKRTSDGKHISWNTPSQLRDYTEDLQSAMTRLTSRNRRLRKVHGHISEIVVRLMNTDLVRQRDKWKDGLQAMRKMIEEIEKEGFTNTRAWRIHWDYQLYKALEYQYKAGLESCHETLPQIETKLVFKNKKLAFEPTFEELRSNYYRELKRFINIPSSFKGVGDTEIFKSITDRNSEGLSVVFMQAEKLFMKLQKCMDTYTPWVALGAVDLDDCVEENLKEVEDWEANFRILKTRGRDVDKLADTEKVDCITVNASGVKSAAEDLLKNFNDALALSLRKSAQSDIDLLEEFVKESLEALSQMPQTVEEIAKSTARWKEVSDNCIEKKDLKMKMEEKGRLLKLQSGALLDLASLSKSWDDLELRLSAHEKNVEEQKDRLKGMIEKRIKEIQVEIEKFAGRWKGSKPDASGLKDRESAMAILDEVRGWEKEYEEIRTSADTIKKECHHFDMQPPSFPELDGLHEDVTKTVASWGMYENFSTEMGKLAEEDWLSMRERLYVIEDFLGKWAESLKGKEIDVVVRFLLSEVDRLRKNVPYLKFVKGDAFTQDHWNTLFRMLQFPKGVSRSQLTLQHFLDSSDLVVQKMEEIKDLQARAVAELTIQEALDELIKWGAEATFSILEQTDSNGRNITLIKEWKEVQTQVGDHQSVLQAMRDSPYFSKFAANAEDWDRKLSTLAFGLNDLNAVQRKWLYLEPIFGRGALPHEQGRFKRVDDDFRAIMSEVRMDQRVVALAEVSGLNEKLPTLIDQLERCQKALSDFLEEKRSKFPRFYFIGDDDLLEILGQSQNAAVIQSHLKKLFQAIFAVNFSEDMKQIVAFRSLEGEVVELLEPVTITETVEVWLAELAKAMVSTLEASLADCMKTMDLNSFPSMILCAAEQICFCQDTERAVKGRSLKGLETSLREKLAKFTSYSQETGVLQLKLKAIILDVIHDIDVVNQLTDNKVSDLQEWYWQKQLRYYFENKLCVVRMCDAMNAYTYEYQGNDPKLVHTPLTDKCYLTLTQGLHLGYGGNPYGPAGTGKTESVKALGQALARQVLVFNCDEGIDYKSMGRIFTGLVKCGAWGCFDEFNRLEAEVLSAVSQQIQVIQAALKEKRTQVDLLGKVIDVNKNSGIFVTLNPAGKGYGGRSELPDNLKQLFRSVAMSAPDNSLIAEVILYAEGYAHAKVVGTKVVELFTLSKQLLSKQQHYDWGLRALKTILLISGKLVQMEKKSNDSIDMKVEMELVIKAVRLNTLAKLTNADTVRFEALIKDIFPGTEVKDAVYATLEEAIEASLKELKLDPLPAQIKKVVQLNENLNQRMGCVIVGPSGCGKSTLLRILRAAQAKMKQHIVVHTMNPKAMPRQQLLGHMDLDTREWFDGVLTASARQVVKEPPDVRSWILCDGDIDPEWVESLNSVLDDNRLLTMPSGERIRFGPNVNFIFETNDLRFASPATVSRMGMIFLSEEDMQTSCLVRAWVSKQPEAQQEKLAGWLDESFDKALKWVLRSKAAIVETTKVGIVLNALSHLVGVESKEQFAAALARGMGSNMDIDSRSKLASEVWTWCNERPLNPDKPLDCYYDTAKGTLAQYTADLSVDIECKDMLMSSPTDRDLPVVQTVDLAKNSHLFAPWLDNNEPFLLVGPEGCGKSMLLRFAFSVKMRSVEVATINCNAQTSAIHVIQKLQQSCTVATASHGRVYRPKSERLVLYLKDINLPKPDKYDTMQLIAFLQQLILYQGFYDGLEWMGIERVQIVCSMNPSTTVGRHNLTTRFTAIVRIAYITYPARDQLQQVYTAYLGAVLRTRLPQHPTWGDRKNIERLAGTLLDFFQNFNTEFSVDTHRHYLTTPRDVSNLVVGLLRYDIRTQNVLELLTYEAQRIFRDRLVGQEASNRFDSQVWGACIRSQWKEKLDLADAVYSTWLYSSEGEDEDGLGLAMLGRSTHADLKECVAQGLLLYEREFKELNMLLFPEIVDRMARLDRVLSSPGGSALLVGRPGVGRRTCVTLACFMHNMEVFTPKVGRNYQSKQFLNDLKAAVTVAGVQGQPACLFIEDYQLVETAFLEIINSLLSSGEVPGMFTSQELDALLMPLKEEFSRVGFKYRSPYAFFVNRVQMHLHIIISLDPSHPDFLVRCESNPALYQRCTVVWLEAWSKQGMSLVPKMLLKETLEAIEDPDGLVESMQVIHKSCVDRGAAPRQYITLLETIGSLYSTKRKSLEQQASFLGGGLSKLKEAAEKVDTLSREAIAQQKLLQQKQTQADQALQEITVNMEDAGKKKQEAQELSGKLAVAEESMKGKRIEVEAELAECTPVLEAAKQAVGSIKKDNLNEIRSLKLPPEPIRDVLEGVLRLMNNQDTSWISMKRFLAQGSVIQEVMNYDARNITKEIRESVRKLLVAKAASFQHENIYRVSVAAAPLAAWVKAQIQYSLVLEKISPLENELNKLDRDLDASRHRLKECADAIKHSDETVAHLKVEFGKLTQEAESLKIGLQRAMETLESAQNLLGKLDEEKDRWGTQMEELDSQLLQLPLNILMSASFIAYLGEAPEDARAEYVGSWSTYLNFKDPFRFMLMMSTETERLTWKAQGLPGDDLSAENAVVILNTKQYPLVIDPSTQATDWLLKYHEASGISVEVTTQQDAKFLQKLELAVRFGKTLVMQEVDRVEPLLFPILRKDLQRQGPRWCVAIGEKMIDFSENFRLFLVTRNPLMEIPPDARPLVARVNFSVTRSGLEGQLLGRTIQHEKPELEKQKSELLTAEEEMKVKLSTLEKQLLEQLASSEGNILENKALIQALTDTKVSSLEIKQALANSHKVQMKLDEEREVYRSFARTGSNVFFLVQTLKSLNYMYQFDLPTYLHLFKTTLAGSGNSDDVQQRLSILVSTLKRNIFNYVGRSLFKADRLTFGMHLVRGMNPELFKEGEWDFFVGLVIADASGASLPDWVPPDRAPALQRLAATMPSLVQGLGLQDSGMWQQWIGSPKPESPNEFPGKLQSLRAFQKMLVVQALRADRLQSAMEAFVNDGLGLRSINLSNLNLKEVSNEVSPTTPIMFIVTPGADPSAILEQTADTTLGTGKYRQLAMGQGQSEAALKMLREGAEEGHWVCLQNVHLVVTWLSVLEKELRSLNPAPTFRLWLTTEPHPRFPPILLQQSLKITFEAPPGLKKNLQNAFSMWSPQFVGEGSASRAQLLFIVAWFHAVVQERRTFIPQGWSKFHEFSFADLRSTAAIISSSNTDDPPWETVHGLLDNAIYGGRIDNVFDQRILRTCLRTYYSPECVSSSGRSARPLPNTKIVAPSTKTHSEFTKLINELPDVDLPALFGLPPNIERVVQQANSSRITTQLKTMATASVAAGGWDKDLMSQQLQPLLSLWQTLTSGSSVLKPIKASTSSTLPVDLFVFMEAESAHKLIADVNKMLEAVSRVLRGVELLTASVRDASVSLAAGLVPSKWEDVWEGPESPALWLQAAVSKASAIDKWLDSVQRGSTLQSSISLNDMFNPSVFLNALRQQTARETNVAVDQLKLVCQWGGDSGRGGLGALPVTIVGTVLQGALFTAGYLTEAKLDTPTVSPLPSCVIAYIPQSQEDPSPDATSVTLPVYEGLDRSKLLTQLRMPCKAKEQDKWILCGVAIFVTSE